MSSDFSLVRNSVLAGYAAGISGTLVGFPLDSLKVLSQTVALKKTKNQQSSSVVRNVRTGQHYASLTTMASPQIFNLRRLYSGVGGPLVTVGLVQAINFAVYDATRRYLHPHPDYLTKDSLTNVSGAAALAGGVLACLTSPLMIIKTQQQIQGISFQQAFQQVTKRTRTMYTALPLHLFFEASARAFYFGVYEYLKRRNEPVTVSDRMIAAGSSGILTWSVFFPLDSIRSRMYANAVNSQQQSMRQVVSSVWHIHGIRGFYRGFFVTVLRAGPVAAAVLPIYDASLQYLNENYR